jgi:phosphoribosylformylglycinamidine synthase
MEQKVSRVIAACIAMGKNNPIRLIHDLGAGGNCNAIPEGVNPAGGKISLSELPLGDPTLSPRETWGNESQERDLAVIKRNRLAEFKKICEREKCPYTIAGKITGDGKIVVYDSKTKQNVVDLNLKQIFNQVPQKTFAYKTEPQKSAALKLPEGLTIGQSLERVLRLLAVGSKRFLTIKVDRSVSGLIAQQQCVGPLQITLADYAMIATSWLEKTGAATSIGERPILELLNPDAMARMTVGEALTNLCFAKISSFNDIRFSANWMWAGKVHDEGARLYKAALALSNLLLELDGPIIDGGKDSLSMAAKVKQPDGQTELVKAPGTLVMSAYAPVPDIRKKVTPDLKAPGKSNLLFIDLANGSQRLGGSALAQVFELSGGQAPDLDDPKLLTAGFEAVQELVNRGLILAGHDRSDGGLLQCLLEMAFSGNCGLDIDFGRKGRTNWMDYLFNEELGVVLEYLPANEKQIWEILGHYKLQKHTAIIGKSSEADLVTLKNNGRVIFSDQMTHLRNIWEETSYHLDLQQANPVCVKQEREVNYKRPYGPHYKVEFQPKPTEAKLLNRKDKPKIAIIREEGSNGDREMQAAFYQAGFMPYDVTMTDISSGRFTLDQVRGVAFVGGFSFADALNSAKGWAGVIRFNVKAMLQFRKFYERFDTFSLGVCNGCQLEALLGWVPWSGIEMAKQPRFIRNTSGRFESRFSAIKIMPSPAIMLKGMEGSVLGIWNAHGEGQFYCPDESMMQRIKEQKLIPIRFVDDAHYTTTTYPFNPNGSPHGITALCSPDGRHLAMMPHPERAFLPWQWGYWPPDWSNMTVAPWLRLFQNAREWCEQN